MLRKPAFAVGFVSVVLVIYCALVNFNAPLPLIYVIFTLSPVLMIWLVYTVLRYGSYKGNELKDDEEWGYQDKNKDELGVF